MKTNKDYRPIEKRKDMSTRSKVQQEQDQSERKGVFKPKEARRIQVKRGSTDKKMSVEE